MHPFYRQYFGESSKQLKTTFRIKYANSTNELPGIVEAGRIPARKSFYQVYDEPHKNMKLLMEDTRMPITKGTTKAFPSPKKHFALTSKWVN